MLLERDEILDVLTDLARRLAADGVEGRVRVLGGAAVAIEHRDRAATRDVDALYFPAPEIDAAAAVIAAERGWPDDWLSDAVGMYASDFDHLASWSTVIETDEVVVSVAPADLLLAMKLLAGRGRRDGEDIDLLLETCGVDSIVEAEEIFERYYPREEISERARRQLESQLGV